MRNDLFSYRRNLPHWRLAGSTYFLTWRLHPSQRPLEADERDLIASAVKFFDGKRYKLYAYVVMDDHCHAVLLPYEGFTLQGIMHSLKSFTANQLQKGARSGTGQVWQREYFDRIVRDESEFWEKVTYIMNNPLKKWPDATEYRWAEWFPFE